ncbi:DUF2243 domain-containing protein [Enterobacter sp.]|uniref:DUF2243 domain-containing protein n=1 Tax=Enterobacter sp. TaxID=42895 RepID=UPI00296F672B|nr:DUF2243 domain-containing protein [Enterobacter sp.]
MPLTHPFQSDLKRTLTATFPLGIGMMAAIDEVVFHQLLAWHHFFEWGTPAFSLLSDGLLHAGELIFFVLGFFMFADLRSRSKLNRKAAWAGFFFGLGAFQLFDGIVDHKVLKLHQIRYVDNILLYDIIWNGFGLLLLLTGFLIYRHARAAAHPVTGG